MIQIYTDGDGNRHYLVPVALHDVAVELFDDDEVGAIFRLAQRLTAADFHTTENIALNDGHDEAVSFARKKLVGHRKLQ